jgi:hypothetical protein
MNDSRLFLAGILLSLVAVAAPGCSSTHLQDGSTSTDGDRTKTSDGSSAAAAPAPGSRPGAPVPNEAIAAPAVPDAQLPGGPSLPQGQQPFDEPPPPSASVLAEKTKALIASTPAVAPPPPKQAQLPPSGASLPAVAPEVIAKQAQYLKDWEQLRPSIATLPPEEQERQQAALKQAALGTAP